MGQIKKKLSTPTVGANAKKKALKAKFEAEKQNKVEEASTRIVNFKVAVGCGCGGSYEWYHGEVPINSDIHDGDRYYSIPDAVINPTSGYYRG